METAQLEPGWHIGPEFLAGFKKWDDLTRYIRREVPKAHRERILRQVVMEDFALRVAAGMGTTAPVVVGTGAVPMREQGAWPRNVKVRSGKLPKSSVGGRPLGDIDVFFPEVPEDEYRARGAGAVDGAAGVGLGGLLRYEVVERNSDFDGHTVARIRAVPRNASGGVEPLEFEIDLKSPGSQRFTLNGGGFEKAVHDYVPVSIPGFVQPELRVTPAEYQFADMLVLANEPRPASELDGEWPRPKDLYTMYQMIKTGRFDGDRLREAWEENPNWRSESGPAELSTYDVFGRSEREDPVASSTWRAGVEEYKQAHPALRGYPSTEELQRTVVAFVREFARAGEGATWRDGAWHRADGSKVSPEWVTPLVSARRVREPEVAGPLGKIYRNFRREVQAKVKPQDTAATPMNRTSARRHARTRSRQYRKAMFQAAELWTLNDPVVLSYGSARSVPGSVEYEQAREFNRLMAQAGWAGRTGAGPGVMEASNRGMREGGGHSQGIGLRNLPREQKPNQYLDQLVLTDGFPERMEALRTGARAYVAFEGGVGTAQEITDILGLMNTGKIDQAPVVFVGTEFWDDIWGQLKTMLDEGKLGEDIFETVLFTDSVNEAADFVIRVDAELADKRRLETEISTGVASQSGRSADSGRAKHTPATSKSEGSAPAPRRTRLDGGGRRATAPARSGLPNRSAVIDGRRASKAAKALDKTRGK